MTCATSFTQQMYQYRWQRTIAYTQALGASFDLLRIFNRVIILVQQFTKVFQDLSVARKERIHSIYQELNTLLVRGVGAHLGP